jgi:hypothetical protein
MLLLWPYAHLVSQHEPHVAEEVHSMFTRNKPLLIAMLVLVVWTLMALALRAHGS